MVKDLRDFDRQDMEDLIAELREPKYRSNQLFQWVHKHGAELVDEMTNLPLSLRSKIRERADIFHPKVLEKLTSKKDNTIKMLLEFSDGETVESVIMPNEAKKRCTVCVSTQVGCPVGCPFCASGSSGFIRNLRTGEIVSQVLIAKSMEKDETWKVTNVVFMGMGEPLLNYDAVLKSVRILNDPLGLNIGQRKITISTAGYVPGILKLAEEKLQVVLAVSLHSVENEVRDFLVPLNKKYPLEELAWALKEYSKKSGRRITFEYSLIEGLNDTIECAEKLAAFVSQFKANVNIIPLNPVDEFGFKRSSSSKIQNFAAVLRNKGVETSVREERGLDIEGACGQLRLRYLQ
ncbi:MAG TPA: 23S rRNA (adenine(2503)-C(2))-methyltransferase RlmN [Peptococcaceae bacterium]|nr:MAG: putative dual-specificity RNA methyltransferase RlmN [Clostridia bacterium 41_269]HBT20052.1 23S rRNA (adenine(2503)-C(2))-methyltransferase RlmN [Peptococcaceae bacterium]